MRTVCRDLLVALLFWVPYPLVNFETVRYGWRRKTHVNILGFHVLTTEEI